ncbi:MAG: hypothetical protein U0K47_00905 [Erysipelotrichaceae bacterium]|nr:hypothetical protein [Erysipelotrichaceae bacterium]
MTINASKRNKFLFQQGKHVFSDYKEAGNRYVRTACKQAEKRTAAQTAEYAGIQASKMLAENALPSPGFWMNRRKRYSLQSRETGEKQ